MRLIDADPLKAAFDFDPDDEIRCDVIHYGIDHAPTIDAVPVVRCYECKHSYRLGGTKILYQCDHNGVRPDFWFCADGESTMSQVKGVTE